MSHVMICSAVRNGMEYLPSYRSQIENLKLRDGLTFQLCLLEGDSTDGTREYVEKWLRERPDYLIAGFESVGHTARIQDRAERWAAVGNACLALIPEGSPHTHVLWLEADLCFPPELLARLVAHGVDIVAPMIWLGGNFYDSWGFRNQDGTRWTGRPTGYPDFVFQTLLELGSVGSCVLFKRAVFDSGIRFRGPYETGLLVGVCTDAREKGFRVFADLSTAILHPADAWEAQMWRCAGLDIRDRNDQPVAISVPEAENIGLEPYLPVFDSDHFRNTNRAFWESLHRILRTSALVAEVEGWVEGSRNRYLLRIRPAGEGLFFPLDRESFEQTVVCRMR